MKFKIILTLFVFITGLCAMVYIVAQQGMRQMANDPQIQIARDNAAALASLRSRPNAPANKVDMRNSLATYVIVYDDAGIPIASTVALNGRVPQLPRGVFGYVRMHHEDLITWQPESGVRHAVVVERIDGERKGFVLSGRSLSEVESRTQRLLYIVGAGWVVLLVVAYVGVSLCMSAPKVSRQSSA